MAVFLFFCVLAPEGMNAIVFGGEGGEIRRLLLAQKIYRPEDYFLSLTARREMTCHFTKNKVVTFRVVLLRDVHHVMYDTHREKHYIATK